MSYHTRKDTHYARSICGSNIVLSVLQVKCYAHLESSPVIYVYGHSYMYRIGNWLGTLLDLSARHYQDCMKCLMKP